MVLLIRLRVFLSDQPLPHARRILSAVEAIFPPLYKTVLSVASASIDELANCLTSNTAFSVLGAKDSGASGTRHTDIKVCCRVKPGGKQKWPTISTLSTTSGSMSINSQEGNSIFKFDHVWSSLATQVDIFSDVAPFVDKALHGCCVCIIAYGQTGSGKTYTMQGDIHTTCD